MKNYTNGQCVRKMRMNRKYVGENITIFQSRVRQLVKTISTEIYDNGKGGYWTHIDIYPQRQLNEMAAGIVARRLRLLRFRVYTEWVKQPDGTEALRITACVNTNPLKALWERATAIFR